MLESPIVGRPSLLENGQSARSGRNKPSVRFAFWRMGF